MTLLSVKAFTSLYSTEDVYVRRGDVKQTLQMKVLLPWCRQTACLDVFTMAFLQTGDGYLPEKSQLPLQSVRMRP